MTSLREHLELQNGSSSLHGSEEASPPVRRAPGLRFSISAKAVLIVTLVAVVAVVSTLCAVLPAHYGLKTGGNGGERDGNPSLILANIMKPSDKQHKTTQKATLQPPFPIPEATNLKLTNGVTEEITETNIEFCETPSCFMAAAQISQALDTSVNPCDDFYQFACGGWMDTHPAPATGRQAVYDDTVNTVNKRIQLILEEEADPGDPLPLHMLRTMYSTCMDIETMEGLGVAPLLGSLELQEGWPMILDSWDPSHFSLESALVNLRDITYQPLLAISVDKNLHNTTENIIILNAGTVPLGIGLMSNPSQKIVDAYSAFMILAAKYLRDELSQSVTDEEIAQQVDEVIQFESNFSKLVIEAATLATDHVWLTNVTEVQECTDAGTPGMFNWLSFFKQIFSKSGVVVTAQEPILSFNGPFFEMLSNLFNATKPRTIANAIGWSWIFELSQETTNFLRDAELDFLQDIGSVAPNQTVHCRLQSSLNLQYATARGYVDNMFFSPSAKEEALHLVEDIREAFNLLLDNNSWMLPDDLVIAKEKLAAIEAFVAYPDWILDDDQLTLEYAGLDIINKEHYNNLQRIGRWGDLRMLQSLRKKPSSSFAIPPTIVNAYYKAEDNAITVTAGILQNPYFAHDSLAALNYGGIGFFMGHEMTHGFDVIGRLYDKDGNLVQWWSNETIKAYNERAVCFIDQYNHYFPPELVDVGINASVNGARTLAENIADNGGIREAYKAYQLYVERHGEEPRLPGLQDFTPDQLFYLGYAYPWCTNSSAFIMLEQLAIDAHSPDRFRVIGSLSNDENFSKVWNCPAGSPMSRGDDRCVLW